MSARPFRFPALLACALIALLPTTPCVAADSLLEGEALIQALRRGGFNIYFRHAATDWSQDDEIRAAGDWESCDPARVRQLSSRGRGDARVVGEAMRALAIPVGQVLASPYCRTVQTAELLGFGPATRTTDVINLRVAEYFGGQDAVVARARALLAAAPTPGTNTIIAAHGNVARASTPVYPQEAEAVVFRPTGGGTFAVVARLTPGDWERLYAEHASGRSWGGSRKRAG